MTVRRHGSWGATAAARRGSIQRSVSDFLDARLVKRVGLERANHVAREMVAEIIGHPNFTPAAENDYYTGLAKWLLEDTARTMSARMYAGAQKTLRMLHAGHAVTGYAWVPKDRTPEVLRVLPKRPPGRTA